MFIASESYAQMPYPAPRTELTIRPSYPMKANEGDIGSRYDRRLGNRAGLRSRPRSATLTMDAPVPNNAAVNMSVRSQSVQGGIPSEQVRHYSHRYETPAVSEVAQNPYQRQPVPAREAYPTQQPSISYPAPHSVVLQPQQPYQVQPVPAAQPNYITPQAVQSQPVYQQRPPSTYNVQVAETPAPALQPQPAYQEQPQPPVNSEVVKAMPAAPAPTPAPESQEPSFWDSIFTPSAQEELRAVENNASVAPSAPTLPDETYADDITAPTPAVATTAPIDTAATFPLSAPEASTQPSSEPIVRYYDATAEAGTAPSFSEDAADDIAMSPAQSLDIYAEQPVAQGVSPVTEPPVEIMPEPVQELSQETKQILDKLPTDLFPQQRGVQGGFDISRSNPNTALPEEAFESDGSIGADIAIRKQSIDINYELEKAYNALLQGQTEMAIAIYKDILSAEPNNKHALFGLATTYHRLNMLAEARLFYGKLIEIDPYNREALNNFLGLVGQEAPESAILYLEQLKDRNRDFSPIYAQLAQLYSAEGNTEQAIINMQQATAISPDNLIYLYNLGVLYDMHGDAGRASVIYQQLIRAGLDGKEIPASLDDLQERLTFLSSNS